MKNHTLEVIINNKHRILAQISMFVNKTNQIKENKKISQTNNC